MLANAYGIFICVAAVAGIGWIIWLMRNGDKDRHDEDDARTFFDAHGHWPDETLEEALAERARIAASTSAQVAPVSRAGSDGLV
jgi:hypothetical protein